MGTTYRGSRPRPGTCIYCARETQVENDHLFPRCLWPKSQRHGIEFILVPSCRDCNAAKSRFDDALRDRVDLDETSDDRDDHFEQVATIARSAEYGSSFLGKSVQAVLDQIPDKSTITGPLTIPVPHPELFLKAVQYIIRALYFHHTEIVFPPESPIVAKFLPRQDVEKHEPFFELHAQVGGEIGNVCRWQGVFPGTDPLTSFWLLQFKNGVFFQGLTQRTDRKELIK